MRLHSPEPWLLWVTSSPPGLCPLQRRSEPADESSGVACHKDTMVRSNPYVFRMCSESMCGTYPLSRVVAGLRQERASRELTGSFTPASGSHVSAVFPHHVTQHERQPGFLVLRPRLSPGPAPLTLLSFASAVATGGSPGITLTTYSRPEGHQELFRTPEVAQALSAPASRLSARQLAMRRGAALGVASATLTAGLVIRVLASRH